MVPIVPLVPMDHHFDESYPFVYIGHVWHSTPVGNEYVRNILINLDPGKSVGMDNISSHLLRLFALSIVVEVTHLFNYFISTQSIPTEWKSSNIIHVHKKGSKSEKSNYCPVSI